MQDRVGRSQGQRHDSRESDTRDVIDALYKGGAELSLLRRKRPDIERLLVA